MKYLPQAVGTGVGVVHGTIQYYGQGIPHGPLLFRLGTFGYGLYRALKHENPTAQDLDVTYALMAAPLALQALYVHAAVNGVGVKALGMVNDTAEEDPEHGHRHGAGCATCGMHAAPLMTPPESLQDSGYGGY